MPENTRIGDDEIIAGALWLARAAHTVCDSPRPLTCRFGLAAEVVDSLDGTREAIPAAFDRPFLRCGLRVTSGHVVESVPPERWRTGPAGRCWYVEVEPGTATGYVSGRDEPIFVWSCGLVLVGG